MDIILKVWNIKTYVERTKTLHYDIDTNSLNKNFSLNETFDSVLLDDDNCEHMEIEIRYYGQHIFTFGDHNFESEIDNCSLEFEQQVDHEITIDISDIDKIRLNSVKVIARINEDGQILIESISLDTEPCGLGYDENIVYMNRYYFASDTDIIDSLNTRGFAYYAHKTFNRVCLCIIENMIKMNDDYADIQISEIYCFNLIEPSYPYIQTISLDDSINLDILCKKLNMKHKTLKSVGVGMSEHCFGLAEMIKDKDTKTYKYCFVGDNFFNSNMLKEIIGYLNK
jgi:hypothetical protein